MLKCDELSTIYRNEDEEDRKLKKNRCLSDVASFLGYCSLQGISSQKIYTINAEAIGSIQCWAAVAYDRHFIPIDMDTIEFKMYFQLSLQFYSLVTKLLGHYIQLQHKHTSSSQNRR